MGKTVRDIRDIYESGQTLTAVTCYDYTFARLVDEADLDVVLVGDSLANVMQGKETTVPVTLDEVVYHCRSVKRGLNSPHLVADMPFMSYQANEDEAVENAGKLLKKGKAQAVKLEGGRPIASTIDRMTDVGIPVVGHLGLTPQSIHQTGGYRVQGRDQESRQQLLDDAKALEDAGAYVLVLEMIPSGLAQDVTEAVDIPTIGIGAGPDTDGQILVLQDLLGMNRDFSPGFVKEFTDVGDQTVEALEAFRDEVTNGGFPAPEHGYED